jgi:hypothetical protein
MFVMYILRGFFCMSLKLIWFGCKYNGFKLIWGGVSVVVYPRHL